jgi:N-acetylneuraminic acid mutarotase
MRKVIPFIILFFLISNSFITFNPVSAQKLVEDSWNTKTPMTQGRYNLGVIAVDGKIYAIGGEIGFVSYVNTNECYDPKTDKWSTLKSMPTPKKQFAIAAYQGKIYCMGGVVDHTTWPDGSLFSEITCSLNEVYDITTNSWSTKAPMPINGSYNLQAHVVDDKIFVISGFDLFIYDPITDIWTKKIGIAENSEYWNGGYYSNSVTVDSKILVFCRFSHFLWGTETDSYHTIWLYDTKTDVWSERKEETMDTSGAVMGVTTGRYAPQRIYALCSTAMGGITIRQYNYVYDFVSDTWSTAKDMPTSRDGFGVAVVDDILYVIGGCTIGQIIDDVYATRELEYRTLNEQYIPIGYNPQGYPDTQPSATDDVTFSPVPSEHTPFLLFLTGVVLTIIVIMVSCVVAIYTKRGKRTRNPKADSPS